MLRAKRRRAKQTPTTNIIHLRHHNTTKDNDYFIVSFITDFAPTDKNIQAFNNNKEYQNSLCNGIDKLMGPGFTCIYIKSCKHDKKIIVEVKLTPDNTRLGITMAEIEDIIPVLKITHIMQKCYPTIQNKEGYINESYNYSTKQYLTKRNYTYTKRAFNFLSDKTSIPNMFIIKDASCIKCNNNDDEDDLFKIWRDKNLNNKYAIYKPNNNKFSQQGAVSGGSRINRLKYQTQIKSQYNNVVNGLYPATIYYNSHPNNKIHNNSYNINCKIRLNGLAQRCNILSDCNVCCPTVQNNSNGSITGTPTLPTDIHHDNLLGRVSGTNTGTNTGTSTSNF